MWAGGIENRGLGDCEEEASRFLEGTRLSETNALPKRCKRAILPLTLEVPSTCSPRPQHCQSPQLQAENMKLWAQEG